MFWIGLGFSGAILGSYSAYGAYIGRDQLSRNWASLKRVWFLEACRALTGDGQSHACRRKAKAGKYGSGVFAGPCGMSTINNIPYITTPYKQPFSIQGSLNVPFS